MITTAQQHQTTGISTISHQVSSVASNISDTAFPYSDLQVVTKLHPQCAVFTTDIYRRNLICIRAPCILMCHHPFRLANLYRVLPNGWAVFGANYQLRMQYEWGQNRWSNPSSNMFCHWRHDIGYCFLLLRLVSYGSIPIAGRKVSAADIFRKDAR